MAFQLSNVDKIQFEQNMTYSEFLEQFQNHASQLLCLIDNKLHFYDKKEHIPKNIHPTTNAKNCYHFEDDQGKQYTVFGIEAAKVFYPAMKPEKVIKEHKPIIIEYIKDDLNLIIYDKQQKYEFPRSNKRLEIRKVNVFNK